MVLARVRNVKSGWKSMFMVYTTAASDDNQMIVRLAFETIEKIVREHFDFITETEVTTFTDCVNCLIAFTNNPHSLDVSLNAIAFLRFCAMKLAEGAIGAPLIDCRCFDMFSHVHSPLQLHGHAMLNLARAHMSLCCLSHSLLCSVPAACLHAASICISACMHACMHAAKRHCVLRSSSPWEGCLGGHGCRHFCEKPWQCAIFTQLDGR